MKRIFVWSFALGMLLTTACNDNELVSNPFETIVSATVEADGSRSNATDEGFFTWSKGDAISVYTSSGNFRTFNLKGEGGTATADFSGTLFNNETTAKCAAYPKGTHSLSGNTLTFNLPTEYGSFDSEYTANTNAALIAPIADGSMNFNFRHIAGVLRFKLDNVPADAAQFVFTAADKDITGDFEVDITESLPSISARAKTDANSVSIKFKPLTEAQDDMVFFVPLPVGTYNGFHIAMKKQDGTLLVEYTHEGSNAMTRKLLALFPEMKFADVSGTIGGEEQEAGTLVNGVAKLAKAGTLAEVLGDEMLTLTSLKIVGEINGTDVKCLRQMLGGVEFESEKGQVTTLDLSEASIIEGGGPYYGACTTTNNVIGDSIFYCCKGVETMILPKNVTTISNVSFYYAAKLKNVTLPEGVTTIGEEAFSFCYGLQNINLPNGISKIGAMAFRYCYKLTSIDIPTSLLIIEEAVFCDCEGITSITIPDNIETIKNNAFLRCDELVEVNIGANVKEIEGYVFNNCGKLRIINCYPTAPPSVNYGAFSNNDYYDNNNINTNSMSLYVPKGLTTAYKATDWGKIFSRIYELNN